MLVTVNVITINVNHNDFPCSYSRTENTYLTTLDLETLTGVEDPVHTKRVESSQSEAS